MKKPIYKQWWFWLFLVIVFGVKWWWLGLLVIIIFGVISKKDGDKKNTEPTPSAATTIELTKGPEAEVKAEPSEAPTPTADPAKKTTQD